MIVTKTSTRQAQKTNGTAYPLSTEQFAENNRVKPASVRHRFCLTGSYFGVRPQKLLNGRLAWPDIQIAA